MRCKHRMTDSDPSLLIAMFPMLLVGFTATCPISMHFGLGAGGCFTAGVVCCGQWFVRRRGLGIGIASSASGLGIAWGFSNSKQQLTNETRWSDSFPIFFSDVKDEVGFMGALRYTEFLIGILLASSWFLVTSRLPRKKWDPETE